MPFDHSSFPSSRDILILYGLAALGLMWLLAASAGAAVWVWNHTGYVP